MLEWHFDLFRHFDFIDKSTVRAEVLDFDGIVIFVNLTMQGRHFEVWNRNVSGLVSPKDHLFFLDLVIESELVTDALNPRIHWLHLFFN